MVLENFDIGKVIVPRVSDEMTPTTKPIRYFCKRFKMRVKATQAKVGIPISWGGKFRVASTKFRL